MFNDVLIGGGPLHPHHHTGTAQKSHSARHAATHVGNQHSGPAYRGQNAVGNAMGMPRVADGSPHRNASGHGARPHAHHGWQVHHGWPASTHHRPLTERQRRFLHAHAGERRPGGTSHVPVGSYHINYRHLHEPRHGHGRSVPHF